MSSTPIFSALLLTSILLLTLALSGCSTSKDIVPIPKHASFYLETSYQQTLRELKLELGKRGFYPKALKPGFFITNRKATTLRYLVTSKEYSNLPDELKTALRIKISDKGNSTTLVNIEPLFFYNGKVVDVLSNGTLEHEINMILSKSDSPPPL